MLQIIHNLYIVVGENINTLNVELASIGRYCTFQSNVDHFCLESITIIILRYIEKYCCLIFLMRAFTCRAIISIESIEILISKASDNTGPQKKKYPVLAI